MEEFDINIKTRGGMAWIDGLTPKGKDWVDLNVDGSEFGTGISTDRSMTTEIAEGAMLENLSVSVNGRQYLGANKVA